MFFLQDGHMSILMSARAKRSKSYVYKINVSKATLFFSGGRILAYQSSKEREDKKNQQEWNGACIYIWIW